VTAHFWQNRRDAMPIAPTQPDVREIIVSSLDELVEAVTPPAPDPQTGRFRDTGVYRGTHDPDLPLLTSLDRFGGIHPPHTKADLEEHILRNFIRYSRPYVPATAVDEWELLVTAQHHGVPTRLLDWTYSPLVAAYFATRDHRVDRDRVVWRLDWQRVHRAFGFPPLALLVTDLAASLARRGPFTPWRLFGGEFDRAFACMLEPPSIDARIVAQAAAFTLCSDKSQPLDAFLAGHGLADALTRFRVPAAHVARLRDQLEIAAVDERRLFPDLDGVAAAIRRYYA
jgi:hypothetical protein